MISLDNKNQHMRAINNNDDTLNELSINQHENKDACTDFI